MNVAELFARGEEEFEKKNYVLAIQIFVAIVKFAPLYTRARYRVADALLNAGQVDDAKKVYKSLAWYYIKCGQPLLGLVVCKMLIALDPSFSGSLDVLCNLYSSESDRVGDVPLAELSRLQSAAHAPALFEMKPPRLFDWGARIAADCDAISDVPEILPRIPLFSLMPEKEFGEVLHSLRLLRAADGEAIVSEGEEGEAFYLLADGHVVVSKHLDGADTVLANLRPGAVFGEMALVARGPRTATVRARGEAAVLELSAEDLVAHAGQLKAVTDALRKFTRGRLLANLAATSPLFNKLPKPERKKLMRKFQSRIVHAGDIIIEEGEVGRGLYVITRGRCEVTRGGGFSEQKLAVLRGGAIFGEMSFLWDSPTAATITATETSELLFLRKEAFKEAMNTHPEIVGALASLTAERLRANRVGGSAQKPTEDDSRLLI